MYRTLGIVVSLTLAAACTPVGPDFVRPEVASSPTWSDYVREDFSFEPQDSAEWWRILGDPALNDLVTLAHEQNNNIRIAGLRVLEARAALAVAVGNQYPQSQAISGDATAIKLSDGDGPLAGGDRDFTQYNLGIGASWEIDFWGRYRRAIEAADASLMASVASFDDALILVTAQVVDTYTIIRTTEERLRIAQENLTLQQRSYDIVDVLFRNGASSELDVQQAETLLLSTKATIPALEVTLRQSKHALSNLIGLPPGDIENLLGARSAIPTIPENVMVGVPADMLRLRPDIRRAELNAMAQNAIVGTAKANLYPSFSLNGSIGLTNTTRTGEDGLEDLFSSDSVTYAFGPSFVWPFLNYGRIKNSIRVEDARLQQALFAYHEEVIQAAREVQDAMVAFSGSLRQHDILLEAVESAKRSTDLSMLRYTEGFADYQRVLDAQQRLFNQQQRYVENMGFSVRSLAQVYRALGGGWQVGDGTFIDEPTRLQMEERIDWDDMLETDRTSIQEAHDERYREE